MERGIALSFYCYIVTAIILISPSFAKAGNSLNVCLNNFDDAHPENVKEFCVTDDVSIIIGDIDNFGFVCMLHNDAFDIIYGLDKVGTFDSAKILKGRDAPIVLETIQSFRGGSNYTREYYVVYGIFEKKLREVLKIPYMKALTLLSFGSYAQYDFIEENKIELINDEYKVSQSIILNKDGKNLYSHDRKYSLFFSGIYKRFIEGEVFCNSVWEKKQSPCEEKNAKYGYIFEPGFSDAANIRMVLFDKNGNEFVVDELRYLQFFEFLVH